MSSIGPNKVSNFSSSKIKINNNQPKLKKASYALIVPPSTSSNDLEEMIKKVLCDFFMGSGLSAKIDLFDNSAKKGALENLKVTLDNRHLFKFHLRVATLKGSFQVQYLTEKTLIKLAMQKKLAGNCIKVEILPSFKTNLIINISNL